MEPNSLAYYRAQATFEPKQLKKVLESEETMEFKVHNSRSRLNLYLSHNFRILHYSIAGKNTANRKKVFIKFIQTYITAGAYY